MADMDVDLEELYDEDEGELYDTPCQVKSVLQNVYLHSSQRFHISVRHYVHQVQFWILPIDPSPFVVLTVINRSTNCFSVDEIKYMYRENALNSSFKAGKLVL